MISPVLIFSQDLLVIIFIVIACVEVEFPSRSHNLLPTFPHPLPPAPIPLKEKHVCYMIKTDTIERLSFHNYDLESTRILKVT